MPYKDEDEIRLALGERLKGPVDDWVWGILVKRGYVRLVLDDKEGLIELKRLYLRHERLGIQEREALNEASTRDPGQPAKAGEMWPDRRFQVVSQLLAKEADQDGRVRRFRGKHVPKGLLTRNKVAAWIAQKAREDAGRGPSGQWLKFYLPQGHKVRASPRGMGLDVVPPLTLGALAGGAAGKEFLAWADEGATVPTHTNITIGGVLHELQALGKELARLYGWQEAQATTYVLTGIAPLVSPLRYGVSYSVGIDYRPRARITLNIDPEVSPAEVLRVYSQVRQSVRSGKRNYPMGEKILTLMEFTSRHRRWWRKWKYILERWNMEYPKWKVPKKPMSRAMAERIRRSGKEPETVALQRALWSFSRDYNRAVQSLFRQPKYSPLPVLTAGKQKGGSRIGRAKVS